MENVILNRVFRLCLLVFFLVQSLLFASFTDAKDQQMVFQLKNDRIAYSIFFLNRRLMSDRLERNKAEKNPEFVAGSILDTDADFRLQVMWTGWRAPGKKNNADNPVVFSKKNFQLVKYHKQEEPNKDQKLNLVFEGINNPFEILLTYHLEKNNFFIKKQLAVRDIKPKHHLLQKIWPSYGFVYGDFIILNQGGFGQPLAFRTKKTGCFFGLEYPASVNGFIKTEANKLRIGCGQEIGERIKKGWLKSEWVVQALTPANRVKHWFMKYVNTIRVAPLRPYLLYNSWYDLRAPEMVKNPLNVMSEKNVVRIIESFNQNLGKSHNIHLDAFVLDDGWDVYRSDWVLRKKQFPRGLKPISEYLDKTNTSLGIWFGPTGGYSNRQWRLDWMKQHGYELVGDQLCLAGEKYKKLFKKRVNDFVVNDGVAYFKWDGIQFSCSQPDHGHATGIYSRRAVMESVIDLCKTVREKNPKIFLNVTSGTWLSPWWVKYANTIWMQGYDYGYADVPSPNRRDRAMTYRDYVLYDGLKKNNFWFPLANLMTHGIIKGDLQKLGGEAEPLDKFTDNALLYFARGVAMWELYVSPDLLTIGEWNAIARSIRWAKDRFFILSSTELIGGDPGERKPYGYFHLGKNCAIFAVRNPFIKPAVLTVHLPRLLGSKGFTVPMVLERTYPTRWISPQLVKGKDEIKIPLQGYETAVYEMYPLATSSVPLLADVVFEEKNHAGKRYQIQVLKTGQNLKILNPRKVKNLSCEEKKIDIRFLDFDKVLAPPALNGAEVKTEANQTGHQLRFDLSVHHSVKTACLAVLLENNPHKKEKTLPSVQVVLNGQNRDADSEMQKKRWLWIRVQLSTGQQQVGVTVSPEEPGEIWSGKISAWMIAEQKYPVQLLSFDCFEDVILPPMPPRPWPSRILKKVIKLKELVINGNGLMEE